MGTSLPAFLTRTCASRNQNAQKQKINADLSFYKLEIYRDFMTQRKIRTTSSFCLQSMMEFIEEHKHDFIPFGSENERWRLARYFLFTISATSFPRTRIMNEPNLADRTRFHFSTAKAQRRQRYQGENDMITIDCSLLPCNLRSAERNWYSNVCVRA